MTDTAAPADGAPTQEAVPQAGIRILGQFVRDFSFENPRAPDSLRQAGAQPNIDLNVEMSARGRPDRLFEVDLRLSAKALVEGQPQFVVELVYGGLFQLEGFREDDIEQILLIECPRFLFPFARRLIADVTSEGGFPPFLLDPIDFAGVYASQRQQQGQLASEAPAGTA